MSRMGLLKKEWLEAVRSYKVLFLPVVFLLLGVGQPLVTHFMPQILKQATLPEGTIIQIPTPPPPEIVGSIIDQYNQLGILVVILAVMGAISREIEQGQTGLIITLGVSRARYLLSKWLVLSLVTVVTVLLGFVATNYYTAILFGVVPWTNVLVAGLVYSLYPLFILTVTLLFSALFTNQLASAGSALGVVIVTGMLALISKRVVGWLPVQAASLAKNLLTGLEVEALGGILVTGAWIVAGLLATYLVLRRRELS